ncbi:Zn-dependent exopeptidase [Cryphonectria parasitica EP155]|uniref:Peptide hydrolase n=1 Tax=Cryphonectria parasitica (strain ATCC 38755 / EP155) TaxID=660469 RepID=A0A9P4Y720_CRYP1|nr:Zn-dependent exopeptidase [Cryphonectria parasitica EP155]KAF3767911.1 Zn-dependent exopeptidase [Cryphonectria parasitica EP155]
MKVAASSVIALLAPAVAGRFVEANEGDNVQLYPDGVWAEATEQYLIELGPGDTRWVSEEEKWELRRNGQRFMDITDTQYLGASRLNAQSSVVFPAKVAFQDEVKPLLKNLSKTNMHDNLEKFTSFHTRYYKSDYGKQSSEWLLQQIKDIIHESGVESIYAEPFPHSWQQSSIIATIPGQTNSTVVVAAHQDSINLWLPSILAAPGADDDGSGTVTILEAFRVFLTSDAVQNGELENTVEFHWYSAEEGGLLGSQAIFADYERNGRDIKAMLQQDMTGFVQRTVDAGKPESVGVIVDYVDKKLTEFIKKIIVEYCDIPFVETKCGYACSDHASASKAGYPSAFVIESAFEDSDNHIHSTDDVLKYLSFDHMLQHAKMTLAFTYELASTNFVKLQGGGAVDEL